MKTRVLFVCHGNICRSPMAEFILKDMVAKLGIADRFIIASAATSTEEIWNGVGNLVYPPAKRELAKHGISCDGKRAVQMRRSDYDSYDYLIGMDSANIRNMHRIAGGDRDGKIYKLLYFADGNFLRQEVSIPDVADPWYTGEFGKTYDDVVRGCRGFLDYLQHINLIK